MKKLPATPLVSKANVCKNRHMAKRNQFKTKFLQRAVDRKFSAVRQKTLQRDVFDHVLLNSPKIRSANFDVISAADLGMLFQLTDEMFFGGEIGRYIEKNFEKPLTFRLSTRMTTAGGTTTMMKPGSRDRETEFEIAIATTPLFGTFKFERKAKVGGVQCLSRLEALQRIMEHEVVHLVELLGTGDSNCQAKPFRTMVRNYFGHLESNHQLLTPTDVARKQLGIRCGDSVTFKVEGNRHTGFVNRITKRATVLVKDPSGIEYDDGVRYAKYYVPLPMLKRA